MNARSKIFMLFSLLVILSMVFGSALADDSIIFRRNISRTPADETEKSSLFMMDFYVPAQAANGTLLTDGIEVTALDESIPEEYADRLFAKPLVSVYIDGPSTHTVHEEDAAPIMINGGIVFGEMEAYVSYSLDDGDTWRIENMSRSADLSSFTLANGTVYPGHVHHVVHQVGEDKILAVWNSKYCGGGSPLYTLTTENQAIDYTDYLADLETNWGKNALYLYDFFGVAGDQGSVDYALQGFPEVGEIPYSCVWAARGKLLPGDDPMTTDVVEATHVVWMYPERLTSGVRDSNLAAVDCAKNAGCTLTWQEDPLGLRPGQGLGPGEGWSGAIANAKTDIWYSYITFADFDYVVNDANDDGIPQPDEAMLIEDYEALMGDEMDRPKPYVPLAMPVRITDNDMCRATAGTNGNPEDPFCWVDFDSIDDLNSTNIVDFFANLTGPEEGADFCDTTYDWTNPMGVSIPICVTEDGRYMIGRVGSTRVRMIIKPYTPAGAPDHDGDGVPDASAWLSMGSEETKALGTTDLDDTVDPVDIGKDMFYYSFDYAKPYNLHVNTALDAVDDSAYIVQQGGWLNQPAQCSDWFPTYEDVNPAITCSDHGEFFDPLIDPITGYEYYLTEIARRFAMTLNNIPNITNEDINESGLSGMLIYKQGVIWQGGPADIMLRRLVVPDDFDATVDNPFAYENMPCDEWLYDDGSNPNYLLGLCMSPAINITGTSIKTCTTGTSNDACAATFPVSEDGSIYVDMENFPKVTEWRNCDAAGTIDGCDNDDDETGDLDDQSWENPFDVAKGHRGFLYGDFVMMMYAWSPNWQSNAVGNDHYNLYQRRSFDGGLTWTTTPAALGGAGITALDYNYGETIGEFVPVYYEYAAGAFEQGRNLSLLHGNKVTILDPRYSPGGGLKQYATIRTDWLENNLGITSEDLPYPDDAAIDPSKFFMVYETGDNTTVAVGEATPLDLFYSRATVYGDIYEWFDYANDPDDCNPDPLTGIVDWTACAEPRFPWLENSADDLSGEAAVVMNPGGTFAYSVWNQWQETIYVDEFGVTHELIHDSDMIYRRNMWLMDDTTTDAVPSAYILAAPNAALATDQLTFIGTGLDADNTDGVDGIVSYDWYSSIDGFIGSGQTLIKAADQLSIGRHIITLVVTDDEGMTGSTSDILVIDGGAFHINLPFLRR